MLNDEQLHVDSGIVNIVNSDTDCCKVDDKKLISTDVVKDALKCCFFNARGLFSKIDELRARILGNNFDVIGVAETWLNDNIVDAEISLDGYKLYRKDRSCVKPGKAGGIVLYVNSEIVSWEYGVLNKAKTESLWCKIATDGNGFHELVVGVCYKSPSAEGSEVNLISSDRKGCH